MPDMMRFLPVKPGAKALTDKSQLTYAATQARAILTHNVRDFVILAKLCAAQGTYHAGIIVASRSGRRELVRRTTTLLESLSAEDIANTLQFL
jgi:hypothetical protein